MAGQPIVFPNDLVVQGSLTATVGFNAPAGSIADAAINSAAAIQSTKVIHAFVVRYGVATGTAIANQTMPLYIVGSASGATVYAMKASLEVACTSTDTVVVDIQRSTGGGAFSTILTAPITFNSSSVVRVISNATISVPSLSQNDILNLVVTGTNSTGQGLVFALYVREAAQ